MFQAKIGLETLISGAFHALLDNIGPAAKTAIPDLTEVFDDSYDDVRKAARAAVEKIQR